MDEKLSGKQKVKIALCAILVALAAILLGVVAGHFFTEPVPQQAETSSESTSEQKEEKPKKESKQQYDVSATLASIKDRIPKTIMSASTKDDYLYMAENYADKVDEKDYKDVALLNDIVDAAFQKSKSMAEKEYNVLSSTVTDETSEPIKSAAMDEYNTFVQTEDYAQAYSAAKTANKKIADHQKQVEEQQKAEEAQQQAQAEAQQAEDAAKDQSFLQLSGTYTGGYVYFTDQSSFETAYKQYINTTFSERNYTEPVIDKFTENAYTIAQSNATTVTSAGFSTPVKQWAPSAYTLPDVDSLGLNSSSRQQAGILGNSIAERRA